MAAGLLAFFVALIASLLLVVPVRALALRVGMVDLPGPRKVHLQSYSAAWRLSHVRRRHDCRAVRFRWSRARPD